MRRALAAGVILDVVASPRYGLLGPLEVRTGDTAIRPASGRQRLLLAVLLVDGNRLVPTDRLVYELWGDALPTNPSGALRTQVSRLRRVLGTAAGDLVTEAGGYRLHLDRPLLDACRFEDLLTQATDADPEPALELIEEALALWRGHALDEFADRPFAQPEAVRLNELRDGAREQRAQILLRLGLVDEAVTALQAIVAEHPGRERARGLMMEALYSAGRHTEALDSYREWRRRLADELGLDPSPDLQRIEQKILQHTMLAGPEPVGTLRPGLPMPLSSFVGRQNDVSSIVSLLLQARFVTLCGPGGVGKTRLALEVASAAGDAYADGVRFCDFVAVRRPTSVARAIATATGVAERSSRRMEDQLIGHLSGQRMLLLLDNCEHVAGPSAAIAERIVRESPGVDVLVTSRVRLGIDGEHVWHVAPLEVHGPHAPAVRLFLERARALEADAAPDLADREAVAAICTRLDGLPLAIELAAACLRGLTLHDLERNLDQRFRLLASEHRADKRHRSLRAVVDGSYEQLLPVEQRVFERLCAFAGRFDLDAACAVAGGEDIDEREVTAALLNLVDCSLVSPHREDGATRYGLLETLRAYGVDRLEERDALAVVRDRHAAWAVDLAERAGAGLAGPDERLWAQTLRRHFDELRVAHAWLVGRDVESSLRLIAALHWFALWYAESEVFRWAEVATAAAGEIRSPLLPTVLASVATGAWLRGELDAANAAARAAHEAARDLDPITARRALEALADVALQRGELDRSVELFRIAYERARAGGYPLEAVWDIGSVAVALAYGGRHDEAAAPATEACILADEIGSPSARALARYFIGEITASTNAIEAERNLRHAVELAESVGSRFIVGLAHVTLASLYARHGDVAAALRYYERVIPEWERTTNWMTLWVTLRNLVDLLARVGAWNEAAVLYGAVRSSDTPPPYGADEVMLQDAEARLHRQLGDEEFRRCTDHGRRLSIDAVAVIAVEAARRARLNRAIVPDAEHPARR